MKTCTCLEQEWQLCETGSGNSLRDDLFVDANVKRDLSSIDVVSGSAPYMNVTSTNASNKSGIADWIATQETIEILLKTHWHQWRRAWVLEDRRHLCVSL